MVEQSAIEWTDSTWNPTTGCTKVSQGCDHCYAETLANRILRKSYTARLPLVDTEENRVDPFAVRMWPERLAQPDRWKELRRIFVNSMSDLFHADIPEDFLIEVFRVMLDVGRHVYQILTKRPSRVIRFWRRHSGALFAGGAIPEHIWIGTSVEDQKVHYRVNQLRKVPADLRFLSCEPLLGPLRLNLDGIHWVIVGGESGPHYRPLNLDWARSIRDQCAAARVPHFFKQVGGRTSKVGGRELDRRTYNEYPEPSAVATSS